jgi:hypothetical protein
MKILALVATFCNQPTGPNLAGYGSIAASRSSATSGSSTGSGYSAGSGVTGGTASSSGSTITPSINPCGSFPPPNELCN